MPRHTVATLHVRQCGLVMNMHYRKLTIRRVSVYPDRGTHSYCVKADTRVVIRNYALRA